MKATEITSLTLVGGRGKFPYSHGNCFSLQTEKGELRVVNFVLENLEYLLEHGITFPLEVEQLSKSTCVLNDPRIPDSLYPNTFCEVCCPSNLLPLPQQLCRKRDIERGIISKDGRQPVRWTPRPTIEDFTGKPKPEVDLTKLKSDPIQFMDIQSNKRGKETPNRE